MFLFLILLREQSNWYTSGQFPFLVFSKVQSLIMSLLWTFPYHHDDQPTHVAIIWLQIPQIPLLITQSHIRLMPQFYQSL